MSVANFSVQNAAVSLSGKWTAFGSPTSYQGHNLMHKVGNDSQIDVVVTGTALAVNCYSTATVSVDGGAATAFGDNSGNVINVVLFTGLSDTAHTVSIKSTGDFFIDQDSTDATHCSFSVTGAAPAISAPSGFGPMTTLSSAAYLVKGLGLTAATAQGYDCFTAKWSGPSVRFYATVDTLKLWMFSGNQTYRLRVDGADAGSLISAGNTSKWNWLTIGSSLDSAAEHLYEIECSQPNLVQYLYSVMTIGGTGINSGKTPAVRKSLVCYGDSITSGLTIASDSELSWVQQLGLLEGWDVVNAGISSSPVGGTDANAGKNRTADVTGLSPAPDRGIILYGTNDMAGVNVSAQTPSQLQASYTTMLQAIVNGNSTTSFYCLGILPRSSGGYASQATIDTYNAAIQAAISAVSPNATLHYVDTKAWNMGGAAYASGGTFDSTNFIDSLHPNAVGNLFMRDKLAALFAPASGGGASGPGHNTALGMGIGF